MRHVTFHGENYVVCHVEVYVVYHGVCDVIFLVAMIDVVYLNVVKREVFHDLRTRHGELLDVKMYVAFHDVNVL